MTLKITLPVSLGLIILFSLIFSMGVVSAWSNTNFNNSLTTENLTFTGNQNITRWLSVPNSISALTKGYLNLSGWINPGVSPPLTPLLMSYYNFDENSGTTAFNSVNNSIYNLTVDNNWTTDGKINGGYTPGYTQKPSSGINLSGQSNMTFNFWINRSSNLGNGEIVLMNSLVGQTANYTYTYFYAPNGANNITFITLNNIGNEAKCISSHIPLGGWTMVTLQTNATWVGMYINGTLYCSADTTNFSFGSNLFYPFSSHSSYAYGGGRWVTYGGVAIIDEIGFWNRTLNSSEITSLWNGSNGLHYSKLSPSFPTNPSLSISNSQAWNYSGQFNQTNNKTNNLASIINKYLNATYLIGTNYLIPFIFHSAPAGILQYLDLIFNNEGFIENSQTYSSSTYETSNEIFSINLTYDNSYYSNINAYLKYNGTDYLGTKIGTGNTVIFSKALDITNGSIGNKSFYWQIGLTNSSGTFYYNSTWYNQTVNPIYFNLCNSSLNKPYINFTFKDESDLSIINASISTSTFEYWLGNGTVKKSLSFANSSNNYAYAFCFSPSYKTINLDYSMQYANPDKGYPQRITDPVASTFTNITTNKTLYLLGSGGGQYVTFQVVNSADQPLDNVLVNAARLIDGENVIVGTGTTGADGGITFWLNPDYLHTFSFSKSGYTQYAFSTFPTSTSYTIVLGGGTTVTEYDYTRGISYSIQPIGNYLNNNTNYNFNFTISSSYWALQKYGFILRFSNGTIIGSTSDTTQEGGIVNLNANTLINTQIIMDFYYVVNNTYINMSRTWLVYDTDGSSFSIWNFFQRFQTYVGTTNGIFGLTSQSFSLNLIIYMFILVVVGLMSYKFGLTSPAAILGILFALVAFFDVVLGLLYNPLSNTAPHFPTILIGIILVGVTIKEVYT